MRLFIAIELPVKIRGSLAKIQEELRSSGADVKWVDHKNIHLTLKFIGETQENKLDAVTQAIETAVKDKSSFYAELSSLGAFPKVSSPRVIWMGLGQGDDPVKQIAKDLEGGLSKIGISEEKRAFSSHITIGRTRSALGLYKLTAALDAVEKNISFDGLGFTVEKITLFKSTLTPKGPVYEALKEAGLKKS